LVQADPWVRRLAIATLVTSLLALSLFLVFKFLLISGASELSALAAQLVK
jgi:hypothetical protein